MLHVAFSNLVQLFLHRPELLTFTVCQQESFFLEKEREKERGGGGGGRVKYAISVNA